jgi:hypothetical protein
VFTFLSAEDVDGLVADVVDRIRKRRREIEFGGSYGSA